MKSTPVEQQKKRKTRFIDLSEINNIVFIQSLRPGTYAKIHFDSGKEIIASYSLNYLLSIVGEEKYIRANKGVLIKKSKIISQNNSITVTTGQIFLYSRRQLKKMKK